MGSKIKLKKAPLKIEQKKNRWDIGEKVQKAEGTEKKQSKGNQQNNLRKITRI